MVALTSLCPSSTRSAILLHPRIADFYRDLAAFSLGCEDRCEVDSLYLGERCIASQFCMPTGRQYTILRISYDQDFARLGPAPAVLRRSRDRSARSRERCCLVRRLAARQDPYAAGTHRARAVVRPSPHRATSRSLRTGTKPRAVAAGARDLSDQSRLQGGPLGHSTSRTRHNEVGAEPARTRVVQARRRGAGQT